MCNRCHKLRNQAIFHGSCPNIALYMIYKKGVHLNCIRSIRDAVKSEEKSGIGHCIVPIPWRRMVKDRKATRMQSAWDICWEKLIDLIDNERLWCTTGKQLRATVYEWWERTKLNLWDYPIPLNQFSFLHQRLNGRSRSSTNINSNRMVDTKPKLIETNAADKLSTDRKSMLYVCSAVNSSQHFAFFHLRVGTITALYSKSIVTWITLLH